MSRTWKYGIPVCVGLLLAVASFIWGTYSSAISGVATILLTAILVSITWYYADETRTLRQEAQMSRLFNLPVIRLTGTLTNEPNVMIRNIGQGFAADIALTITELEDGKEPAVTSLDVPVLGPGEGIEFSPRSRPIRGWEGFGLGDRSVVLRATGEYRDASGRRHSISDEFSLSDYITRCERLGVDFAKVSHENEFQQSKEEKEFRKSMTAGLKTIADTISRLRF